MGRINTGRLGLKSDKHRGPTALGVYFFKPRPTGVYSTHLKPPRNDLFLKQLPNTYNGVNVFQLIKCTISN